MATTTPETPIVRMPDDRDLPASDDEQVAPATPPFRMPDDRDLPDSDGAIVDNHHQLPQSILLTESIRPLLQLRHPDGRFLVGSDSGIYWRYTDPPLRGVVAPDWYYIPGVAFARPDGRFRHSYALWIEQVAPSIVLEFASGDGSKERDATPEKGKFWVYEQMIRVPYYGIYQCDPGRFESVPPDGRAIRAGPGERSRPSSRPPAGRRARDLAGLLLPARPPLAPLVG